MVIAERCSAEFSGTLRSQSGPPEATPRGDDLLRPDRVRHCEALTRTIEQEIIPRLLLVRSSEEADWISGAEGREISDGDVEFFTDAVLWKSPMECICYVETIRAQGASVHAVLLDLFAPTARRLGTLWTEDVRSFTDVTIALGTLQQVFRHFAPTFEAHHNGGPQRRAFLVPAPGEQHTFGLFILETCLYRAGWQVDALPSFDADEVRRYLRAHPVQLIGVSASCDRFLDGTASAIQAMRDESEHDELAVMVGGRPFSENEKSRP